jgi:hypothetical protein
MRRIGWFILLLFAVLSFSTAAHASSVTGSIAFGGFGNFNVRDNSGPLVDDWSTGTGVQFSSPPNAIVTNSKSGTFAIVPLKTDVSFLDFNTSSTNSKLWSFTDSTYDYEFVLSSASRVSSSVNSIVFTGTGDFYIFQKGTAIPGYDKTPGTFDFTANKTSGAVSFSASSAAVPIPGSVLLLGSGLLGLFGLRRKLTN